MFEVVAFGTIGSVLRSVLRSVGRSSGSAVLRVRSAGLSRVGRPLWSGRSGPVRLGSVRRPNGYWPGAVPHGSRSVPGSGRVALLVPVPRSGLPSGVSSRSRPASGPRSPGAPRLPVSSGPSASSVFGPRRLCVLSSFRVSWVLFIFSRFSGLSVLRAPRGPRVPLSHLVLAVLLGPYRSPLVLRSSLCAREAPP